MSGSIPTSPRPVQRRCDSYADVFPTPQLSDTDTFDVISALAVLEHVPQPAQAGFAGACARHLAPNGMLAITVPAPIVDSILALLKGARLIDGMHEEEHLDTIRRKPRRCSKRTGCAWFGTADSS